MIATIILLAVLVVLLLTIIPVQPEHFGTKSRTCVLLKSHVWSTDLEKFALKLLAETEAAGADLFILMHAETDKVPKKIASSKLKSLLKTFTESEIKSTYDSKGFQSMWLSNHWIIMWFFRSHSYDYYWSIEYDVRISGNSSKIWSYSGAEDFIYPIPLFQDLKWPWNNHYVGPMTNAEKYQGYLQLARYSSKFLTYLDAAFASGENGQDEMIIFSLFVRSKLSGSHQLLHKLIDNSWSVDNAESDKHKKLLSESDIQYKRNRNHLRIYHPIK